MISNDCNLRLSDKDEKPSQHECKEGVTEIVGSTSNEITRWAVFKIPFLLH